MPTNSPSLHFRVSADLSSFTASMRQLKAELGGVSTSSEKAGDAASRAFNGLRSTVRGATGALSGFLSVYSAISAVKGVAELSDQFAQINGVLMLATNSSEEFAKAQQGVFDIAQATRAPLAETAATYAAIQRNTKTLGLSQDDLLKAVETVNKAVQTTPVSAQAAQAALTQFGQALGGDFKAGAQELNSILEQTPGLAVAIADGMGVATSDLKKMGEQGKLSTEAVIRGLLRISDTVDEKFSKVPRTVSGAIQQMRNELVNTLGRTDMTPLVEALDDLRKTVTDPEVQQGLATIAAAIARVGSVSVKAASAVGDFAKWIGEELAAAASGVAADDIPRLNEQIRDLEKVIADLKSGGGLTTALYGGREGRNAALAGFERQLAESRRLVQEAQRGSVVASPQQSVDAIRSQLEGIARGLEQVKQTTGTLDAAVARLQSLREQLKAIPPDTAGAQAAMVALNSTLEAARVAAMKSAQADAALAAQHEAAKKAAEGRQKQITDMIASLEEEASTYGKSADEVVRYRLALLGAAQAEIDRAVAAARSTEAQKVSAEATERQRKAAEKLVDTLAELRIREMELAGDDAGAQAARLEQRYREIRQQMLDAGDESGAAGVERWFNAEKVQGRLDDIKGRVQRTVDEMREAEQTSAARVAVGGDPAVGEAEQRATREAAIEQLKRFRAELQALPPDAVGVKEALSGVNQSIGELTAQNLTGFEKALVGLRAQFQQMNEELAGDSARALQDSLTGLFTDLASGSKSAGEALKDFVRGFAQSMAQIAARALATYLVLQLLDAIYPGLGKTVASTSSSWGPVVSAGKHHTGGIAGQAASTRMVPAMAFAQAPRFSAGGLAGLETGEVPAILKKGEEVLTKDDPRHVGNQAAARGHVRIVNVFDANFVPDQMESAGGEKVILNAIGRNPGFIRQILANS